MSHPDLHPFPTRRSSDLEGVVDEVRVIARDVGGGRDRIQHLEIRVRDEADRSAFLLRVSARRAQRGRRRGGGGAPEKPADRKSTRLNSSHTVISYAVFCL